MTAKFNCLDPSSEDKRWKIYPLTVVDWLKDFFGFYYSYLKRLNIDECFSLSETAPAITNCFDFNAEIKEF